MTPRPNEPGRHGMSRPTLIAIVAAVILVVVGTVALTVGGSTDGVDDAAVQQSSGPNPTESPSAAAPTPGGATDVPTGTPQPSDGQNPAGTQPPAQ